MPNAELSGPAPLTYDSNVRTFRGVRWSDWLCELLLLEAGALQTCDC